MDTPEAEMSRKAFIKQGVNTIVSELLEWAALPEAEGQPPSRLIRPPGALIEDQFIQTCEPFCADCRHACPKLAIFEDAWGLPYLNPNDTPCVMCTDVPCTQVCPTGALTPLSDPGLIQLGIAQIEVTVCSAFQGSGCQICYHSCPIKDSAIVLTENLPQVIEASCTGCGVCVMACPEPEAIQILKNST